MQEYYMPEFALFERVENYLRTQGWNVTTINKNFLDNGDVEFNVFLKSNGQTSRKILNIIDFEELVRMASGNMNTFKVVVAAPLVGYVFGPKLEAQAHR